jgi:hypothetical protein
MGHARKFFVLNAHRLSLSAFKSMAFVSAGARRAKLRLNCLAWELPAENIVAVPDGRGRCADRRIIFGRC